MRAVQLVRPGGSLVAADVDLPSPGQGEAILGVAAAGICRSDVHYRNGHPPAGPLPLTLGHEIAGTVEAVGPGVDPGLVGLRVCVHYQVSCGACDWCARGSEQFCPSGAMLGKGRDGGYAEQLLVPARNLFPVPEEIPLTHAAVMMCSSATVYHALRKARLRGGDTVALFGVGGLGMSAVQIARAWGAARVLAVDIDPGRLALAARLGAEPVDARNVDPVQVIRRAGGADVALELVGLAETMTQAVRSLGVLGRAVAVGVAGEAFSVNSYADLIGREAEIIGSSDHLAQEINGLLDMARRGQLVLDDIVTTTIPLDAAAVNVALDRLEGFGEGVRTVIVP